MSSRKKSKQNKTGIVLVLLLLVVIIGAVFFKVLESTRQTEQGAPQQTQNVESPQAPVQPLAEVESTANKTTPVQNDGEDPNASPTITGSIATARVSGNNFVLRLNIDQYINSGTCNLKMTNQAANLVVEKSVEIFASASTSTCQGFDIPITELTSGTWLISIDIVTDNKKGNISGEYTL